jgi:lipoyl(octanoyl) transferase
MKTVDVHLLGRTPYRECWDLQRTLVDQRARSVCGDRLLLTEHDPVYTFGTGSDTNHLLASPEELNSLAADVVHTDRGGDVTFHGPGQLVVYPILDLTHYRPDLHWYLRQLEEVVLRTLKVFGISAGRMPEYTGVWVSGEKICALGVRCSRWVTSHGLALNVAADLTYFGRIIPCGIFERGVTSMEKVLGNAPPLGKVGEVLIREFGVVFDVEMNVVADSYAGVSGEPFERATA